MFFRTFFRRTTHAIMGKPCKTPHGKARKSAVVFALFPLLLDLIVFHKLEFGPSLVFSWVLDMDIGNLVKIRKRAEWRMM